MSEGRRPTLLAYLRRLGRDPAIEGNDAQLLERFIRERDEAAFTSLMQRHGPLVWNVCRRVLAEEHAAEDAFQATFLVLVRKARSVSKRASLRSWLYGVALRVALRARQREGLRRVREQRAPPRQASEAGWDDVRPILDEEIQRLPEKYRLPVILCYLEGQTNDEAARQLNCPRGTIATRLARARERLRSRLIRRGLTLSVGTLTSLLADNAMSPTIPPLLFAQTVKGVAVGAASVSITTLAEGVLYTMSVKKLMTVLTVAAVLLLAGSMGVGAYYFAAQQPNAEKKEEAPAPAAKAPEKEPVPAAKAPEKEADALTVLMRERLKVAQEEVKMRLQRYKGAQGTVVELVDVYQRLFKAELELSPNKEARIAAHQRHVKESENLSRIANAYYRTGQGSASDALQISYLVVDAKIELEREKARK